MACDCARVCVCAAVCVCECVGYLSIQLLALWTECLTHLLPPSSPWALFMVLAAAMDLWDKSFSERFKSQAAVVCECVSVSLYVCVG